MKQSILTVLVLLGLLTHAAFATITLTATPSSQVVATGGTFNVTLSLTISSSPPPDMTFFDLVFEAASTQNSININNLFAIINRTIGSGLPASWAPDAVGSDILTSTNSDHAGFVQTNGGGSNGNEGWTGTQPAAGDKVNAPFTSLQLATYTFSLAPGVTPGTYNFGTTVIATSAAKFSDVGSTQPSGIPGASNTYPMGNSANFSITVVPEPATWSIIGLGTLSLIGFTRLRRKS